MRSLLGRSTDAILLLLLLYSILHPTAHAYCDLRTRTHARLLHRTNAAAKAATAAAVEALSTGLKQNLPVFGLPEFGFIGASNAGKSSLLNCISGSKIARTSKMPGRTQSVNLFRCSDGKGNACVLADLPGYGFANIGKDQKFNISKSLEDYLVNRPSLQAVFVLFDIRRGIRPDDESIVELLDGHDRDFVLVATKVDKLSTTARRAALEQITAEYDLPEGQPIEFSSVTGEGREAIWQYIRKAGAHHKPPPLPGRPVWGRGAVS